MRRIPLKTVDWIGTNGQSVGVLAYGDALIAVAKAPFGGLSVDEMDRAELIEAMIQGARERGQDSVLLEEADWAWLAEKVRINKWPWLSVSFRELVATVAGAPKLDINEVGFMAGNGHAAAGDDRAAAGKVQIAP